MKQLLATILIFQLISVVTAQTPEFTDSQKATQDAMKDAEQNISAVVWLIAGFGCNLYGLGYAAISTPEITPERLIGKTPVYVVTYVSVYQKHARNKRLRYSSVGCCIVFGVGLTYDRLSTGYWLSNWGTL